MSESKSIDHVVGFYCTILLNPIILDFKPKLDLVYQIKALEVKHFKTVITTKPFKINLTYYIFS